jgi:soluble lytic murein transglycosylase-like protein
MTNLPPSSALRIALWVATVACAGTARADVIEIDAAGLARVRAEAGAVEWTQPGFAPAPDAGSTNLPAAALTTVEGSPEPREFSGGLARAADLAGVSPVLLEALIWQESRWRVNARSSAGAIGLGQLMPGTARQLGVDPRDPEANMLGAARYLRQQLDRFDNDIERALAAYNAGPLRVQQTGGIPRIAETQAYVAAITGRLSTAVRR